MSGHSFETHSRPLALGRSLDGSYPRKYSGFQMERDVEALLAGKPLPEESDTFLTAWKDAEREAIKSEYSFRSGYNVYKQVRAA